MKAPFTHTPVAPSVPADYPLQRYFIGPAPDHVHQLDALNIKDEGYVRVYRSARNNDADLVLGKASGRSSISASFSLTPDQLRELASRLLDAAHDIETNPAEVLAKAAS
ncbi:MAG TPA: hypothetical protein VN667_05870 [Burkholderiales bacterium]|nr:hypothetical protein [Burkholderiales bacterium]